MTIHIISNDDFFSRELMMGLGSEVNIEISTNSLMAINEIRKESPHVIILDNDSDGLNPLVFTKLVKRDRGLEKIRIFFVINDENFVDDSQYQFDGVFAKNNNVSLLIDSLNKNENK